MIKLIDFQPNHFTQINPREIDARYTTCLTDLDVLGKRLQEFGPAVTLMDDDYIIASGGVNLISPGVGDCWVFCNQNISRYKYGLILYTKGLLKYATDKFNLHRLQADVSMEHEKSIRFMKFLRFHIESVLYAYGPNEENYLRFARFPRKKGW